VGGKWSFDSSNCKRLPAGLSPPVIRTPEANAYILDAQHHVERHFPLSPGSAHPFVYPVTYDAAGRWLKDFCRERLAAFGDFEDAMSQEHAFLFHSVLNPALNIGLLTPQQVLDEALASRDRMPLNSLEGFVRQVLGWREYMRGAYEFPGRGQRTCNFWLHERLIPRSFWSGTVGIPPVDAVIRRVLGSAYAHHIERSTVLASFMLLCAFHPEQIYSWFMVPMTGSWFQTSMAWLSMPMVGASPRSQISAVRITS
jgi:deoxyribodipyrimidine photolyase-related protein